MNTQAGKSRFTSSRAIAPLLPERLHRSLLSLMLAAVLAIGGALAHPTAALAAWDVERYDRCMADNLADDVDYDWIRFLEKECCHDSGGVWSHAQDACVAPATKGAGMNNPFPSKGDNQGIDTESSTDDSSAPEIIGPDIIGRPTR